jgi:hypothetical protein
MLTADFRASSWRSYLSDAQQIDQGGRQRKDLATGKGLYAPVVELDRRVRDKSQALGRAAVDRSFSTGEHRMRAPPGGAR